MKKILLVVVFASLLGACKQDNIQPSSTPTVEDFSKIITSGSWSVSSYTELTEDKFKMFSKITFTFTSDGKLLASDGKNTVSGTWSKAGSVYYGQPTGNSAKEVSISLGGNSPYDRLSKSWLISEISNTNIKFESSNPAENKFFVFSK
jgi:hypothetical protein